MKSSLRVVAGWIALSLVLTGCGAQTKGTGNVSGPVYIGKGSENSTVTPSTGNRLSNKAGSGHGGNGTSSGTNFASGNGSLHGGGGAATSPVSVAFAQLQTGPLNGVWFAPRSGAVNGNAAFQSGQIGYVTDTHHIYETHNGGTTWAQVGTVSGSIDGVSSDVTSTGHGTTAVWTKTSLLVSQDGGSFQAVAGQFFASVGAVTNATGIEQVSVGGSAIWVLDAGTVYRMSPGTPATKVSSSVLQTVLAIAAVDASTCYAVASDSSIFKTTDGGKTWTQVFWPPLNAQLPWQAQIQVSNNHVAVLYWGGDRGVNEVAYILVESNDGGQTWAPMFDEAGMSSDYGNPPTRVQNNLGQEPGPFALLPSGNIVFLGAHAANAAVSGIAAVVSKNGAVAQLTGGTSTQVWQVAVRTNRTATVQPAVGSNGVPFTLSTVTPAGKVVASVPITPGNSSIWPDFAHDPAAIAAAGGTQVFLAGGMGSKGVILESLDGGATWHTD